MNIVGISINHRNSPVELREELHLNKDEVINFIPELKNSLSEGFVLSTCNRTEIFGYPKQGDLSVDGIIKTLEGFKPVHQLTSKNYDRFFSCGAVKHIFSVSSGIDSLVLGDSQILGQVRDSFEMAKDLNFAGTTTRRLFDAATKVGRRTIKETLIGEGAVTVSYAAVQVIEKIFANLEKKHALVIGAGETGELAAVHLRDKGIGRVTITNRTESKSQKVAEKINGDVLPFTQIAESLHQFDIIVSATSAPDYIISKDDVKKMMRKRRGTPVCMMDIAVPRDIDPGVKDIENVFYNDIDSLQIIVKQNMKKREKEIPLVEDIIMEELVSYFSWYNTLEVVPAIKSIREFFEEIRQDELTKIRHKVSDEDYIKLENMTRRMVGRLLHNPTMKLKEVAESGADMNEIAAHTMIAKDLFGLNNNGNNNNHKD